MFGQTENLSWSLFNSLKAQFFHPLSTNLLHWAHIPTLLGLGYKSWPYKKDFYIPPSKRNNEELKANIARIDKGKNFDVNAEVSKPMSETPPRLNKNSEFVPTCRHCHIVGHIRPNFPIFSTSKVRPPSRKSSSSKTTHVCHLCGGPGHTRPNCFKLFPHKRVSNRSHPLSKGCVPILGELLKTLSFLT